ncbi:hypothetical protein [Devosia sp. UYZn731]|uniref:hypothetical protein n=1 Tax=Devosia sp. UYZn731 TaxID=3156345 RepID=UPI0033961BAC
MRRCTRRKVVFVHGCFWHGHAAGGQGKVPAQQNRRECRTRRAPRRRCRGPGGASCYSGNANSGVTAWVCGLPSS